MAKSNKSRTRAANLAVPQNAEEAAAFIHELGALGRQIARIEHDMNDDIAAIKQRAEALALPWRETQKVVTEGLRIFCDANRAKLTDGGKVKFHQFGTGKVEWRLLPPKVTFAKGVKAEDVIAWCEADDQYSGFVRIKKEIDKELMLGAPLKAANIPGVSIGSAGEQFMVSPFETQIVGGA